MYAALATTSTLTRLGPMCIHVLQKMSTDKSDIKLVCKDYAKEILADDVSEVEYNTVLEQVKAVGGANYGTGVR